MVLLADAGVGAQGQVDQELADVLQVREEGVIRQLLEVLKDHLMDHRALVGNLLLQFGLVDGGELGLVNVLKRLSLRIVRLHRLQFVVLQHVVFENLAAEAEERSSVGDLLLRLAEVLLKQNVEVHLETLFFKHKQSWKLVDIALVPSFP